MTWLAQNWIKVLFVFAHWIFSVALFSVWFFFAALLSSIIYVYFRFYSPMFESRLGGAI